MLLGFALAVRTALVLIENIMVVALDILLVLLAIIVGYAHASLVESWCHDAIWHARKKTLRTTKTVWVIGTSLRKAWKSHSTVHHKMSYRRVHTIQFQTQMDQDNARNYCLDNKLPLANQFGLTVDLAGFFRFMAPFMILNIVVVSIAPLLFALPFVLTSFLPALFSTYIHPYMHQPLAMGLDTAPLAIRLVLQSRLGREMWVHHFVHHRHPRVCFNLGIPVGDWLRGVCRRPSPSEISEIRRIGGPAGTP